MLGKVFWSGALVRGASRRASVEAALTSSAARSSSVPPHLLDGRGAGIRLLAHVGSRRCLRADPAGRPGVRHVAAAEWIEERAGDRVEDLADVLAHHYSRRWNSRGQPVATWRTPRNGRSRSLAWPLDAAPASTRPAPRRSTSEHCRSCLRATRIARRSSTDSAKS